VGVFYVGGEGFDDGLEVGRTGSGEEVGQISIKSSSSIVG
jgi:hypothetical protein